VYPSQSAYRERFRPVLRAITRFDATRSRNRSGDHNSGAAIALAGTRHAGRSIEANFVCRFQIPRVRRPRSSGARVQIATPLRTTNLNCISTIATAMRGISLALTRLRVGQLATRKKNSESQQRASTRGFFEGEDRNGFHHLALAHVLDRLGQLVSRQSSVVSRQSSVVSRQSSVVSRQSSVVISHSVNRQSTTSSSVSIASPPTADPVFRDRLNYAIAQGARPAPGEPHRGSDRPAGRENRIPPSFRQLESHAA